MLGLVLALLEGQSEDTGSGVSADCVAKSLNYPYFDGVRCVSCIVGTAGTRPFFSKEKNECVSVCPTETPSSGRLRICETCISSRPYWDVASGKCRSCSDMYAGKRKYLSPMFGDCVAGCPAELASNGYSCRTCKEIDQSKPFWDTETQKCSICPEGRKQNESLCLPCADSNPDTPYWNEQEQKCQSCRDATEGQSTHWDPNTGACVATCPTTQPSDEDAWCPPCSEASPQRPLWDEDSKKCVACPEGLSWRRKP